ncbi:hypothetical protein [Aquicoccus sp. SU-CL01552]|uniref:hypothetical protein n=1 Tax=Aquicoccus sp. SU-CL01552 TaxID=3127656 RepID=UPI00310AD47C
MFLNYHFSDHAYDSDIIFKEVSTDENAVVADGVHIAVDPKKGCLSTERAKTGRLRATEIALDARWLEVAIFMDQKEWLECRCVHVKFRASAKAATTINPAIRLLFDDGFHDLFLPEKCWIGTTPTDAAATYHIPPNLTNDAQRLELHLFLEPEDNCYELYDLVMTGVI